MSLALGMRRWMLSSLREQPVVEMCSTQSLQEGRGRTQFMGIVDSVQRGKFKVYDSRNLNCVTKLKEALYD
jgi:hypothetical protein